MLAEVEVYITGGRQPPSDTDCRALAFGQIREAVVVTDDLGMHRLAGDFELPIWHGWELLAKMRSAKKVDNDLIREIVTEMGATAITITHDMTSVRAIADRVAMLHDGLVRWQGPIADLDQSGDAHVDQFIHGRAEGPIKMEIGR